MPPFPPKTAIVWGGGALFVQGVESSELVVAVTSVTLPIPGQRRLVCCWEFNDYHLGIIKTSLINFR